MNAMIPIRVLCVQGHGNWSMIKEEQRPHVQKVRTHKNQPDIMEMCGASRAEVSNRRTYVSVRLGPLATLPGFVGKQ